MLQCHPWTLGRFSFPDRPHISAMDGSIETYKSWHLMRLQHRVGLFGKNSEVSFGKETYDQRLFSWSGSVSQTDHTLVRWLHFHPFFWSVFYSHSAGARGGGLGSRPKKMYGERLGDGVEYHSMKPTPRRSVPFTTGRRFHGISWKWVSTPAPHLSRVHVPKEKSRYLEVSHYSKLLWWNLRNTLLRKRTIS